MAEFKKSVITTAGLAMLADAMLTDTAITFTQIAVGAGEYTGEELTAIVALKDPKQVFDVTKVSVIDDNNLKIQSRINNDETLVGYYIREIGIYGKLADGEEKLVAITIAEKADYFPDHDTAPVTLIYENYLQIQNCDKILFQYTFPSGVYATQEDMEALDKKFSAPTYEEVKDLEELTSGEKYTTAWGKLKKAVKALIDHIGDKKNPHGVTKAQVGLGKCDNTADKDKSVKSATSAGNADTVDGKHFADIQTDAQARADKCLKLTGGTVTGNVIVNADLSTSGNHGIYWFRLIKSNDELHLKSSGNTKNVNVFGRLLNVVNAEATSNMDVQCLNVHYGGSLVHDSYRGAKENISKALDERIRKILEVPIESFDYRPGFGNDKKDVVGVIVDEIEKIIPEAVEIPEDWNEEEFNELLGDMGNKTLPGVNATAFVPYLIGMVQILNREIEELKGRK